jgi:hypothetical protein
MDRTSDSSLPIGSASLATTISNAHQGASRAYASGRRFFVNNQLGDDFYPGTEAKPLRTIAGVNARKPSRFDQVLFRAGQTFKGNLVVEGTGAAAIGPNEVVIDTFGRRSGNRRAVIDGSDGTAILVLDTAGITVSNLQLRGSGANNTGFGIQVLNRTKDRLRYVRLNKIEAHGFKLCGIYVGGTPALPGVIQVTKPNRWGFEDVVLYRCNAHDNTYYGILTSGPWAWEIPADPSKFPDNPGFANKNVRALLCRAYNNAGDPNFKENHSGNGILIDDTDDALVTVSLGSRNGAKNGSESGGPVGIWANQSRNVRIRFCAMGNNRGNLTDGDGGDLDGGVQDSVMEWNVTWGNDGAGCLVWNYWGTLRELKNNIIRFNLSWNDVRKFTMGAFDVGNSGSSVSNISIYGNVAFLTRRGIRPAAGKPIGLSARGNNPDTNLNYWGNLVIVGPGVTLADIEPNSQVSLRGNVFIAPPGWFRIIYDNKIYNSLWSWLRGKPSEAAPPEDRSNDAPKRSPRGIPCPLPLGPLPKMPATQEKSNEQDTARN